MLNGSFAKLKNVDKEVLIQTTRTPPNAIFTPNSYKNSQTIIEEQKLYYFWYSIYCL